MHELAVLKHSVTELVMTLVHQLHIMHRRVLFRSDVLELVVELIHQTETLTVCVENTEGLKDVEI